MAKNLYRLHYNMTRRGITSPPPRVFLYALIAIWGRDTNLSYSPAILAGCYWTGTAQKNLQQKSRPKGAADIEIIP